MFPTPIHPYSLLHIFHPETPMLFYTYNTDASILSNTSITQIAPTLSCTIQTHPYPHTPQIYTSSHISPPSYNQTLIHNIVHPNKLMLS